MKKNTSIKKILIIVFLLILATICLYFSFANKKSYQLDDLQISEINDIAWKNYSNSKYRYDIDYFSNWTYREYPSTESGAGFIPSDKEVEVINIDERSRPQMYCDMSFEEYVKIAGPQEIQNFESLNSIEEVAASSGEIGYKTTWKYTSLEGEELVSLPMTYFENKNFPCENVVVSLNSEDYLGAYNEMIKTFDLN